MARGALALALFVSLTACGDGGDKIVIDLSGGGGDNAFANAASAGQLQLETSTDDGLGNTLLISESGEADASFAPTTGLIAMLGSNPLVVSLDLVVPLDPSVEPPEGDPYALAGSTRLFVSDGDSTLGDEDDEVSGLQVEPGARLTLPLNSTFVADFDFTDDIQNEGEITVLDVTVIQARRGSLELFTGGDYFGAGAISTYGSLDGHPGGDVRLTAGGGNIYNAGPIDTSGGDSAGAQDGGLGGSIILSAWGLEPAGWIENTGDLTATGGDSSGAGNDGGHGGHVSLLSRTGLRNSGDIDASGGDAEAAGGQGGDFRLEDGDGHAPRAIYNSGDITSSGGDGTAGSGGYAGPISLVAWGGALRTSGDLFSEGGDGSDSEGGVGESGNAISLETRDMGPVPPVIPGPLGAAPAAAVIPAGDITVSGTLCTRGGDGGDQGGDGGPIRARIYNETVSTRSARLLGYDRLVGQGGSNVSWGGDGTTAHFYLGASAMGMPGLGTVTVEPSIDFSGGDADAGEAGSVGGEGGDVITDQSTIELGKTNLGGGKGATPGAVGQVMTDVSYN